MVFRIFKKPKILKKGKTYRWYYTYTDPNTKQRPQKACKGCKTRKEAEAYIRTLNPESILTEKKALITDIAKNMYIPESPHIRRLAQLGRALDIKTILEYRRFVEKIINDWGSRALASIKPPEVATSLMQDEKHGNIWKGKYIMVFTEIYDEARWQGLQIQKPIFDHFVRHTKKPDIFSTEELHQLFIPENFTSETYYMLFLLCLSAGLRLGEVLAVQRRQILFERKALIIDGFCKENGHRTHYNKKGSNENNRFRVTMLPNSTLEKLTAFINHNNIEDNDFVFSINGNGQPIPYGAAVYAFQKALRKAKITGAPAKDQAATRKLSIHSLRHTYVTRMRRALPAETIRKAVGHMSTEMTDYYTNKLAVDESLEGIAGLDIAADKLFE
jgi:integrase